MASSWASLYSDFRNSVKLYTEKLDVTPPDFMRKITRAIQQFQRDTKILESYSELTYNSTTQSFPLPSDYLLIILLKDANDYSLIQQEYTQMRRNIEQYEVNKYVTPSKYSYEITRIDSSATSRLYQDMEGNTYPLEKARLYSIYGRNLYIYPYLSDTTLKMWYTPDMAAFDETESMWSDWFPLGTVFDTMFRTTKINPTIGVYEEGLLSYTIAQYLKSLGSSNYIVYENKYREDVKKAIEQKTNYTKQLYISYSFAPYS